jgi:hypothetical protein
MRTLALFGIILLSSAPLRAEDLPIFEATPVTPAERFELVEPFTANTLKDSEMKLGLMSIEYAPSDHWMVGTDFLALALGAPNFMVKAHVYDWDKSKFSIGVRAAYLNRNTILWGSVKEHFERLEARIISPSVSWSNPLSPRLHLHTHWGAGFGQVEAQLTKEGKRKLWESKHPGGDFERDDPEANNAEGEDENGNKEKKSVDQSVSFNQRTLQFSSVTNILSDIFQMTGEYRRENGNKVLIASRIERTKIEQLKADSFRLTAAQQWVWQNFQFRFGIGVKYIVINGTDLDGEELDEAGVFPASDIDFYWRF